MQTQLRVLFEDLVQVAGCEILQYPLAKRVSPTGASVTRASAYRDGSLACKNFGTNRGTISKDGHAEII